MHTIPIFGVDDETGDLGSLLRDALPDAVRLSPEQQPDSVNMDPATLALIIAASKEVLVAAIGAVAAVWAAKVAASAKNKASERPEPEVPKRVPTVEIDTLTDSYIVVVDERFELRLREVLPENIGSVLDIRLTSNKGSQGADYG